MIIDVVTIFPEMFSPVLGESIIKRARDKGLVKINVCDLRDHTDDIHKKVDAPSYGGGGMVFGPQPVFAAVESILGKKMYPEKDKSTSMKVILMSPQGKTLNQEKAKQLLGLERLVIIAPRYEGIDQRVIDHLVDEEISIGDYVLSGGELSAMVLIDSIVRLIPGVVSDQESIKRESFENNLLDYPHYTRPQEFRGLKVPSVLVSGDHEKIEAWRKKQAKNATEKKRPDLLNEKN